jgi:nucleoid DNA-binding protein
MPKKINANPTFKQEDLCAAACQSARRHYCEITRPQVNVIVDYVLLLISRALAQGSKVNLRGLGVFEVIDAPANGKKTAHRQIRFLPSKALKKYLESPE